MTGILFRISCVTVVAVLSLLAADYARAHHVLGRPSYALNEDSNTPSAVQGEAQLGDFRVTYMVFPAFPRPGEQGRVNLYVKPARGDAPFQGKVTFSIRDNSWRSWFRLGDGAVKLGTQRLDDSVFRQVFRFPAEGEYIISANFDAGGTPHTIDIPLRIGAPMPMGIIFGFALLALVGFVIIQRRRSMTGKLREFHAGGAKK
jgi:hypothetical protein